MSFSASAAPADAKRSATPRPMPLAAPVTKALRPSNSLRPMSPPRMTSYDSAVGSRSLSRKH